MDPIDIYSKIQTLVKNEISNFITDYFSKSKYSLISIPAHKHTGVDSPKVAFQDIDKSNKNVDQKTLLGLVGAIGIMGVGKIYQSVGQTIPTSVYTKLNLNTSSIADGVTVDTGNHRLTIVTAGYYQINCECYFGGILANNYYILSLYKNGLEIANATSQSSTNLELSASFSDIFDLAIGDHLELYVYQVADPGTTIVAGLDKTRLSVHLINFIDNWILN